MHFLSLLLLTGPAVICAAALPNSTPNPTIHSLFGRDEALNFLGCGPSDAVPCSLKNAQDCVNYMIAAGETMCNANEENYTVFCAIDKCRLVGQAVGAASASSYWYVIVSLPAMGLGEERVVC